MGGEVFRRTTEFEDLRHGKIFSEADGRKKAVTAEIWKGGDRHAGRWPSWIALTILEQSFIMLLYDQLQNELQCNNRWDGPVLCTTSRGFHVKRLP